MGCCYVGLLKQEGTPTLAKKQLDKNKKTLSQIVVVHDINSNDPPQKRRSQFHYSKEAAGSLASAAGLATRAGRHSAADFVYLVTGIKTKVKHFPLGTDFISQLNLIPTFFCACCSIFTRRSGWSVHFPLFPLISIIISLLPCWW